jgi:Mrp family chromosome partitioning ATPase/uncharacterized protein involved in exopolysaccharide biosynthesis
MKQQTSGNISSMSEIVLPTLPRPSTPRKPGKADERGVRDYLYMLKRRWKLATIVSSALLGLILVVILMLPATYRADVLVVIQPPSVTTSGNNLIIQPDMERKMASLNDQVLSRRTLQEVIRKFDLFSEKAGVIPQDEIFELVKKSITLKMGRSSFTLYFEHTNSQTAADVANELANYYIGENKRIRRNILDGTSSFIQRQLDRLKKELQDAEDALANFKKKHEGELPQDVPANQALLMSLSSQVAQTEASIEGERVRRRKTESRISDIVTTEIMQRQKLIRSLQNTLKQFAGLDNSQKTAVSPNGPPKEDPDPVNVSAESDDRNAAAVKTLKDKLEDLNTRLAKAKAQPPIQPPANPNQDTPEVVKIKNEIRATQDELERLAETKKPRATFNTFAPEAVGATDNMEVEQLRQQLIMKELATRDADSNVDDMEKMFKRGLIAEKLVEKARVERERITGELRLHRTNILRTKAKYVEDLKNNESDLASLRDFQNSWDELLLKAQEIEAQRMRIQNGITDDVIRDVKARVEKHSAELSQMRQKQSQEFVSLFKSNSELGREVSEHESIMANLMRMQSEVQTGKTRVAELDRKLTSAAKVMIEYPELERKYHTVVDQYEGMLRKKNDHEMDRGVEDMMEGERMVIWDPAIPTSSPYKPKYLILIAAALLLALGIGAGSALGLEMLSPKFLNSDVLRDNTGIDVLARFDLLPGREASAAIAQVPQGIPQSAAKIKPLYDQRHRLSKQFLDATCLLFKPDTNWPRIVAVCSPGNCDGKSFVAANLAAALAVSRREPTLLVDANLRSPSLHAMFDKPLASGLAEALEGGPISAHAIEATTASKLQLITAGYSQRFGAVLLGSKRFREIMEKLTYEGTHPRIILDTAPLQGGADVDVLLDAVDGVLLVVRRGHTTMADVRNVLRRIPHDKLLGVVFNGNVTA